MSKALILVICVPTLTMIGAVYRPTTTLAQTATNAATGNVLPSDVKQVIADWRAAEVVPLASAEADLRHAVNDFQNAGLETVSTSFPPTEGVKLTAAQSTALTDAVVDFLLAYHSNDPTRVFSYMEKQGEQLDDERRTLLARGVARKSTRDLSKLSAREFYVAAWKHFKMNSHWDGLAAEECTWQPWNGSGMAVDEIRQIETDALSNPLSTAAVLSQLFQGNSVSQPNFIPAKGSLGEELKTSEPVILADVKLVIQLDQSLNNERVAYIVRFWFNRTAGKWQPIAFVGIPWSPTINAMPMILH